MARPVPACARCATSLLVFLVVSSDPAPARTTCIDYGDEYAAWTGSINFSPGGRRPYAIEVDGAHAYVVDRAHEMMVFDLSTPDDPELVTYIAGTRRTFDAVTVDGRLHVIGEEDGYQILDVSDPATPTVLGSVAELVDGRGVDVSGSLACVAGSESGLHVLDVSDPTNPVVIGTAILPGTGYDVAMSGTTAYVAGGGSGVHVVDLGTPSAPTIVTTVSFPSACLDVLLHEDVLYAGVVLDGVWILDVSMPTSPAELSSVLFGGVSIPSSVHLTGLDLAGTDLFVSDREGLTILDVSDPSNPTVAGSLGAGIFIHDVAVGDGVAYVARLEEDASIQIADVSPARTPVTTDVIDAGDGTRDVLVDGDHAYVSSVDGGFRVYDVTDPVAPVLLGELAGAPGIRSLITYGSLVYGGGFGYLHVIDVGDPFDPQLLYDYPTPGEVWGMTIEDQALYLALDDDGLHVVNLSTPELPTMRGHLSTDRAVRGVAVRDDLAFLAGFDFLVVDVSSPTPVLETRYDGLGQGSDVLLLDGDLLYSGGSGVRVWDLSIPLFPTIVESIPMGVVSDLLLDGDYLFATTQGALQAADVSDPLDARVTASVRSGYGYGLARTGEVLLQASGDDGIRLVPAHCTVVGVDGVPSVVAGSRLRVSPRPMRGAATIELALSHAAELRVDVHDATGRHVRRVFEGSQPEGRASFRWDGRDRDGHASPAGVYFVRAMGMDGVALGVDRVVLVR